MYVGVAPRQGPRGGRDAVERVHTLWADCDGWDSVSALHRFRPLPSVVVRSGSDRNCHAYWALGVPVSRDLAERANRQLAHHLDADRRTTDAARILRPPGTRNHKHDPPEPVEAIYVDTTIFELEEVVGHLPDPDPAPRPRRPANGPITALPAHDPLQAIPPAVYIEALTGQKVGRNHKIACPFHDDTTPSLHVYNNGWYCFGCEAGGSIIDLGARLYGVEARGPGYTEIRERLERDLRSAAR